MRTEILKWELGAASAIVYREGPVKLYWRRKYVRSFSTLFLARQYASSEFQP